MFNGYHNGGFMMGFGWIFFILIIALIIYLLSNKSDRKSAKEILDERYAKGEIELEEYIEKKKNLME